MADYDLILIMSGKAAERYQVTSEGLFIGRGPDNHSSIQDQLISRRHARVWLENGKPHIEDLGSRNGVQVNGKFIQNSVPLRAGDIITLGNAVLRLRSNVGSTIGHTVIGPEMAEDLHAAIMREADGGRLLVLYKAAQLLGAVFDVDALMREILEIIFEALPVRRGFVLLCNPQRGELEIHAALSKEPGEKGPPLSRTLVQHVLDSREAMLTIDAQEDSRFDAADSIVGHDIHSAMCAPLIGRNAVAGAIYVDSGSSSETYDGDTLGLLTAIACVVGVAVENARLYEENMRRARLAAIGEATAGLGHCVKNILTNLRGGCEFVTMAVETKELVYLEKGWPILSRSIERIDALVMNMLSLSKDRPPESTLVDINAVVQEVLDTLRSRADRYKVALEFHPAHDGVFCVDSQEIYRLVLNLTTNAIEACATQGGKVTVACSRDADGFRIQVADTGCGIPADFMPKLFQAFASSKGSSGTGLGLPCCQKIVQEHGGTIDVESEAGKGAVFSVFLPHAPNGEAPPHTPEGKPLTAIVESPED